MLLLGLTEAVAAVRTPIVVGVSRNSLRLYPWLHRVIPNGVDLDMFAPDGTRAEEPTVLFVGTYHGRKRGALLMEAFERDVRPAIPDARAVDGVQRCAERTRSRGARATRRRSTGCARPRRLGLASRAATRDSGSRTSRRWRADYGSLPHRTQERDVLEGCASARLVASEQLGDALRSALSSTALLAREPIVEQFGWPAVVGSYERLYV